MYIMPSSTSIDIMRANYVLGMLKHLLVLCDLISYSYICDVILSIHAASPSRVTLCGIGGTIFLVGTIGLAYIGQDGAAGVFGHTGGKILNKISNPSSSSSS